MCAKRVILDATGSVIKELHVEDPSDLFSAGIFNFIQDCEPVVEHARTLRDMHGGEGEHGKLAATVPMVVYQRALAEGWADDPKAWARFLNDPENRDFRVWAGRV